MSVHQFVRERTQQFRDHVVASQIQNASVELSEKLFIVDGTFALASFEGQAIVVAVVIVVGVLFVGKIVVMGLHSACEFGGGQVFQRFSHPHNVLQTT